MTPLQRIKDRCTVDEITGCWIWKGATSPSNGGKTRQPRVHSEDYTADPTGKVKTTQTGNRAAWHAANRKPIPSGHRVFKAPCCTNGLCVNPAHLQCGTTEDWGQSVATKGIWRGVPARIAANRAIGRANSVVTPEMAREIAASPDLGIHISARLGIGRSVVSRVRRGQLRSIAAVTNPFAGLLK